MKKDYTKIANRILKVVIPEEFPIIKDLEVTDCFFENKVVKFGFSDEKKYSMNRTKFLLDVTVYLEENYVKDTFGDIDTLSDEQFNQLYGEDFAENLRKTMFKALDMLSVGDYSHFDEAGTLSFEFI